MNRLLPLTAALLALLPFAGPARAETVNCTVITSLPAVITSQGVYCLKGDLATAQASGAAVLINTNNVTLDCNGFKLGGLAAGAGSQASGVQATSRQNISIRNCNLRGFGWAINVSGGGHAIEDNRIDGSLGFGILLDANGYVVRGNQVFDTGGGSNFPGAVGMYLTGEGEASGNTVTGVVAATSHAYGMAVLGNEGGFVGANQLRDVSAPPASMTVGLLTFGSPGLSVRDNTIAGSGTGSALRCGGGGSVATRGNHLLGFAIAFDGCSDSLDNVQN